MALDKFFVQIGETLVPVKPRSIIITNFGDVKLSERVETWKRHRGMQYGEPKTKAQRKQIKRLEKAVALLAEIAFVNGERLEIL